MVHVRKLDGKPLHFGHRGWLWHDAFLLYDHETDSIWHHQTGWAMSGPRRGRALARLPASTMTFGAWRAEHPDTLVLPKPTDPETPVDADTYAERNAALALGVGVDLAGDFRLYPFDALSSDGVVEEVIGDLPLVVARDRRAGAAFAYDRRVDGETLSFARVTDGGRPVLREAAGPRRWYLRTGLPVAGRADEALRPLLAATWETFAWRRQHPAGTVYPARVPRSVPR